MNMTGKEVRSVKDPLAILKCAWICRLLKVIVIVPTSVDYRISFSLVHGNSWFVPYHSC
jgi:hypothetical protein